MASSYIKHNHMKDQSIFQMVVLGVFVELFILGFLGFSEKIPQAAL